VPLSNDYANATLAQARIESDEQRLRYHEQISQIAVQVETALSNLRTGVERLHATNAACDYARAALSAEEARYRTGVSDTHELLQYQQELISALGNQVQTQLDLEIAKLSLKHAEGTLLRTFQINFALEDPHRSPWYSRF
jgi:outer membrane protein TolC